MERKLNPGSGEREQMARFLFWGIVLLLAYLVFRVVQPFLLPLAWAGVLALCAQPICTALARRWRSGVAALVTTLLVALLLVGPALLLVLALVQEAGQALEGVQQGLNRLAASETLRHGWAWAQAHLPVPGPDEIQNRFVQLSGQWAAQAAAQLGNILQNVFVFVFKLFVTLFALYFLLRDRDRIGAAVRGLLPFTRASSERFLNQARALVFAGVTTTIIIAVAQGTAGGILFALLGINAAVFWGFMMAALSPVPVVGASLVWLPAALWLISTGAWGRGLILLACGVGVISMLDSVLRPLLMSGRSAMNGLVVFISLLGGLAAFGFIGLILGPVVVATALAVLQLGAHEELAAQAETGPEDPAGE